MKLCFKQRIFSWFDSYDIYDEDGNTVFTVEGKLSWGKCLHICTPDGEHIATLKQAVFTFLPRFDFYVGDRLMGSIKKEFTFLRPRFLVDYNGWSVEGNFLEWDYRIMDQNGDEAALVQKEIFRMSDTYVIDIAKREDALGALMVVLAIDAEKDSRSN